MHLVEGLSKKEKKSLIVTNTLLLSLPVDAAAAPISTRGIANVRIRPAAAVVMILTVVSDLADKILWWKHWYPRPPSAWETKDNSASISEGPHNGHLSESREDTN